MLPTLDKFPKEVLAAIDIQRAFIVSRLIIAAERLQLFRVLYGKRMTASVIGRKLNIRGLPRDIFLDSLVSLGLLRKRNGYYSNTPFANKYFIRERSIHWTRQYSSECVEAYEALAALEQALSSGKSCATLVAPDRPSYTAAMRQDPRRAEDFTQMLFHLHREDAAALAKRLDLSGHRAFLDVGGGSGVMAIALARKNPQLGGCVLDIAPVCQIATRNIRRAHLSKRISTHAGDIRERLPTGYDVVLLSDIGPLPSELMQNVYDSLPPGGLVVAVDRYLSADRTKPLDRVAASLIGSSFPYSTRTEVATTMRSCGFRRVKATNVHRDLWAITGKKPDHNGKHENGTGPPDRNMVRRAAGVQVRSS